MSTEAPWPEGAAPWRKVPVSVALAVGLLVVHVASGLVYARARGLSPALAITGARSPRFRVAVGGQLRSLVDDGEVWRLATSVLLHVDGLHCLVNALSVLALGRLLEPRVGGWRLLGTFLVGGTGASLASHLAGAAQSDGASGGAFALLGAALVVGRRARAALDEDARFLYGPLLWGFLMVNLVFSVLWPGIDLVAHLSGLLIGALLARLARPGRRTDAIAALLVMIYGALVAWPLLAR